MTIIAKCKHNLEKYCNNWDGKDYSWLLEDEDHLFLGQCPENRSKCPFLVTPKPSPELKAK